MPSARWVVWKPTKKSIKFLLPIGNPRINAAPACCLSEVGAVLLCKAGSIRYVDFAFLFFIPFIIYIKNKCRRSLEKTFYFCTENGEGFVSFPRRRFRLSRLAR